MIKAGITQKSLTIKRSAREDLSCREQVLEKEVQAIVEMPKGLHVHPSTIVHEFTVSLNKLFDYYLAQEVDITLTKVWQKQQAKPDSVLNLLALAVARGDRILVKASIAQERMELEVYRWNKLEQLLTMVVRTYGCLLSMDDESRMDQLQKQSLIEIKDKLRFLSKVRFILSVLRPLLWRKDH